MCHSQHGNESDRRNIAFQKVYLFNKSLSTKQLHLMLFSYYRSLLNGVTNYEEEVIQAPAADQRWRVLMVTNSRFDACSFCGKNRCENCLLPFDDQITLGDLLAKIKPGRYEYKFELEIYWRKDADVVSKVLEKVEKGDLGAQSSLVEGYPLVTQIPSASTTA